MVKVDLGALSDEDHELLMDACKARVIELGGFLQDAQGGAADKNFINGLETKVRKYRDLYHIAKCRSG